MTSINRFRRWLVVAPLTLLGVLVWDVAAAAWPQPVSTDDPRRRRGVAATRLHGLSTSQPRRRRDSS